MDQDLFNIYVGKDKGKTILNRMEDVQLVSCYAERLAAKSVYASDVLQNILSLSTDLDRLNKKLTRYVCQIKLLLTWRRGSSAMKMAGSAAKTVASVMVMAAPLHPKLCIAMSMGHKLWRLGTGLKILNTLACIVKDLWQNGCRKCLLEFAQTATALTKNLGVFGEVIRNLQQTTQKTKSAEGNLEASQQLFAMMKPFIPRAQHLYVAHVSSIIFGCERYSPLFDFIALTIDPADKSLSMQLVRELESFNFPDFAEETDSQSLLAISVLLHLSRELLDFLDGFHKFTDKDCIFLHECLVKFTQESTSIIQVVSFLMTLNNVKENHANLNQDLPLSIASSEMPKDSVNYMEVESPTDTCIHIDNNQRIASVPEYSAASRLTESSSIISVMQTNKNSQVLSPGTCQSKSTSDVIGNLGAGKDEAGGSNLKQSIIDLPNLLKRSSSYLLSIPKKSLKKPTTQFQGGDDLNRL